MLTIFRHADLEGAPLPAAVDQKAADVTTPDDSALTRRTFFLSPFLGWFRRTIGRNRSTDDLELADVETSTPDRPSIRTALPYSNQETDCSAQPPRDVMNSDFTRSHGVVRLPGGIRIEHFEASYSILSYPVRAPTRVIYLPPGTYYLG